MEFYYGKIFIHSMVEEINEGNMRGGIFIIIIIKKGLKSMKM